MLNLNFHWTNEARYRARFEMLWLGARSVAVLGGRDQPDSVWLSPGYQEVIEGTCLGYSAAQRANCFPLALAFIEGKAFVTMMEGISPARLGRTLFLDRQPVMWIDCEGREFEVLTVFAGLGEQILVATSDEFRLGEAYLVDRQLLKADVIRVRERVAAFREQNRNDEGEV